jgi:hypothetical protein
MIDLNKVWLRIRPQIIHAAALIVYCSEWKRGEAPPLGKAADSACLLLFAPGSRKIILFKRFSNHKNEMK